jgi:hypothetical protein
MSQPSRRRTPLVGAAMACVLAGCVSQDGSSGPETTVVAVAGISFEAPAGWEELDADEVAEESGESSEMAEVADGMGVTLDQLTRTIRSVDLLMVSDEGPGDGFIDNLNVVRIPGRLPNDDRLLKQQFGQLGADVKRLSHERTELGDTTVAVVELEMAGKTVQGELLLVYVRGKTVCVTIGTSERETTDEVADRVLDTQAEAS